jgi:hypothetical protein
MTVPMRGMVSMPVLVLVALPMVMVIGAHDADDTLGEEAAPS